MNTHISTLDQCGTIVHHNSITIGHTHLQQMRALLSSPRMGGMSARGSITDLSTRIYGARDFVIATFKLDKHDVYSILEPVDEFHSRACDVCKVNDFHTGKQLFLCDGCNGCYHMGECSGMRWVPQGDWLCNNCIASGLLLVDEVLDKRKKNGSIEYLIRWTKGEKDDDGLETWQSETDESWQRERDMPRGQLSRAREKINKFNASQRPTK